MNDKRFKLFKLVWGIIIALWICLLLFKSFWPWIKEQYFNEGLTDPFYAVSREFGGWETPGQNPEKPTIKRDSARASDPGSK